MSRESATGGCISRLDWLISQNFTVQNRRTITLVLQIQIIDHGWLLGNKNPVVVSCLKERRKYCTSPKSPDLPVVACRGYLNAVSLDCTAAPADFWGVKVHEYFRCCLKSRTAHGAKAWADSVVVAPICHFRLQSGRIVPPRTVHSSSSTPALRASSSTRVLLFIREERWLKVNQDLQKYIFCTQFQNWNLRSSNCAVHHYIQACINGSIVPHCRIQKLLKFAMMGLALPACLSERVHADTTYLV